MWHGFSGVLRMELQLAFRDPSLPLIVIGLLAFCQLLMPPAGAPYAVLTVNNLKPLMSAGPMLLATGAAFGAIAFPAYVLYLGRARSRDLAAGVGPLYLSTPLSTAPQASSITFGRVAANVLLALASLWFVLPLLLISICLRTGGWPGVTSILAYFGIAAPVVITAACAALILDAAVISPALKSTLVVGLWFALLIASVSFQKFDFFGLRFVGNNIFPEQDAPSLAVGFISGKMNTVPWNVIHETSAHLLRRLELVLGITGAGLLTSVGMAATFRSGYTSTKASPARKRPRKKSAVSVVSVGSLPPQASVRALSIWTTVYLVAQRYLRHAKAAKFLFVVAVLFSLGGHEISNAATFALLIPITLFGRSSTRNLAGEQAVRFTTASLWRPTPACLETLALFGLVVLPVVPALIRGEASVLHAVHFFVGAFAACGWLILTHRIYVKPLLGVFVYLILWYLVGCNSLPPALDLLGIHGTSFSSLIAVLTVAVLLFLAIMREGKET